MTGVELHALVGKLATMSESFSDQEQAALAALVALAGDGLAAQSDVEGFQQGFGGAGFAYGALVPAVQTNGVLIGLLRSGTPGLGVVRFDGGGGLGRTGSS